MNSRRARPLFPALLTPALAPALILPVLSSRAAQAQQKVVNGHLRVDTPIVNARDIRPSATTVPKAPPAPTATPAPIDPHPAPVAPGSGAVPVPGTTAPSTAPSSSPTTPSTAPVPSTIPVPGTTPATGGTATPTPVPTPRTAPPVSDSDTGLGGLANTPLLAPAATPASPTTPAVIGVTPPAEAAATTGGVPIVITPPATNAPAPATTTPTSPDPDLQSGQEGSADNFSFQSDVEGGVVYDGERGLAISQGPVTFTYGEFQVRGDRGVVDYNTQKASLAGNLTVTVRGREIKGQSLTFDLQTGQWTLSQLTTTFEPEFFTPGTVLEPVYVYGSTVVGNETQITGNNFTISTCDRGHYYLKSTRIEFYRDAIGQPSKIALRKSALYLFGRKVLPLPAYVISLTGQRSRRIGLQPTVGQNDVDGFFAKTSFDLAANRRFTDTLLVDLLQKRGLGLGLVREFAGAAGLLSIYAISGRGDSGRQLDAKLERAFNLAKNIQGNINFQRSQNNQTTGLGNSNTNGTASFVRTTPRSQSNLILNLANSSGSGFSTGNNTINLSHSQQLGNRFSLNTNSLFATNSSTGTDTSRQLQNLLGLNYGGKTFDALARVELYNDLTRTSGSPINQLSRLPELTLTSSTDRVRLPLLSTIAPGDFSIGLGSFIEPRFGGATTGDNTTENSRTDFAYNMRPRQISLLRRGSAESTLTMLGRFQQDFYSGSYAKYDYSYGFGLNNRVGPFSAQVNYAKLRELGSTPFAFDFVTPSEAIDATLAFQPSRRFRLNLSAGRDLQNGISYDIIARLQAQPLRNFYTSLSTTYSPTTSSLGDIIGNFQLQRNPTSFLGGTFDLGVRYSSQQSMLAQATAQASFALTRKTRVEALGSYNGFTKQFDTYQFRVTQDLHCFNLYATYDSFRKQFRLDLALKAFPYFDTRYGLGPAGQGFSPIIGGTQ